MPRNLLVTSQARIFLAQACESISSLISYEVPERADLSAQAHAERFEILVDLYRIGAGGVDRCAMDSTELRLLPEGRAGRPSLQGLAGLDEAEPLAELMVAGLNALGAALEVDPPDEREEEAS